MELIITISKITTAVLFLNINLSNNMIDTNNFTLFYDNMNIKYFIYENMERITIFKY